jgi:CPA1 family monovalent cation:H+ antiporter
VAYPIALSPETVVSLIIFLSFLGAILSAKLKTSYPTIIVVIGLALSLLRISGALQSIPFDRSNILGFVVPPMIFQAAMRTHIETFRTVEKTVISLAVFGVVISAIITGLVINVVTGVPLAVALMFGVIIAPTDPVSVVSLLKRVRSPERLTALLESEAYLNNATPVILYSVAASLSFNPTDLGAFAYNLLGGVGVGLLVSVVAELLYKLITEPLADTSFTIAVMFGSYVLAESFGMSGLMAVPIAGLYMGNRTMRTAMSEETRSTTTTFWEVATFMATSFAFLLIGLKTDFTLLITYAPVIIVAFLAILAARVISVYPIVGLAKIMREKIAHSWTRVIAFAGLRGAVSIALALSLPETPFRNMIVAMTFGVALLSLVVQPEIMKVYLRTDRLTSYGENEQQANAIQTPLLREPMFNNEAQLICHTRREADGKPA